MSELIFRCHSLGELMGVRGLGKTGQKRAIHAYIENTDGRYKEIKSKYPNSMQFQEIDKYIERASQE